MAEESEQKLPQEEVVEEGIHNDEEDIKQETGSIALTQEEQKQEQEPEQEPEPEQKQEENLQQPKEETKSESDDDEEPTACASNDPEGEEKYKLYKRLVKEINCQNQTINTLKDAIKDIECKACTTDCERSELKTLIGCLDCEMKKLRCLISKAMNLQNFGSARIYKDIVLATTFEEDQL